MEIETKIIIITFFLLVLLLFISYFQTDFGFDSHISPQEMREEALKQIDELRETDDIIGERVRYSKSFFGK